MQESVPSPEAQTGASPFTLSLDGEWDFTCTPQPAPRPPAAESFTTRLVVPGYWDDQGARLASAPWWSEAQFNPDYRPLRFPMPGYPPDTSLPYLLGVGWYQRRLEVPQDWQGRRVTLTIGGAVMRSDLFVNGSFVAHHLGHSTPFTFDLSDHLRYGEANRLVLAVSNLDHSLVGCSVRGYPGYSGGLYRGVQVHVAGPARIEDLFVRLLGDLQTVRGWADLEAPHGAAATTLEWRLRDLGGTVVREGALSIRALEPGERYRAEWDLSAEGLDLWSTWHPHRYRAEVRWRVGDETWDEVEQTVGLRALTREGRRLRLNGRPILLRGVCEHCYFAPYATPPTSVDYYRNLLERLRVVGYNFVRCHTWVPPQEYLQAADEVGVLVHVELPSGGDLAMWREMVTWCRQHPSVVIYCGGNEDLCDEAALEVFEARYAAAKELDPGGLVVPQEAMRGIEYFYNVNTDELAGELSDTPFLHHPGRLARITECADAFGQFSWGRLSYGPLEGDWRELERLLTVYDRPVLSHEIGIIGCYLDLELASRYTDRLPPDLFRELRRVLTEAGRLEMAGRYYRNSARWQSLIRKYTLEKARYCDALAGFNNLGGWDTHWHRSGYACGALNEFFELKHGDTAEALRQSNGESVVLLDHGPRRSFRAGEAYSADVRASLYGGLPLVDGRLAWRVEAQGETLAAGERSGLSAPDGAVTGLGALDLTWPEVACARKVTLHLSLRASGYEVGNAWDFWLFPHHAPAICAAAADDAARELLGSRYPGLVPLGTDPAPRMRVVRRLTQDDVSHLRGGGDVLLLGCDPFPARPTSFQIGVAGRPQGNLATVIDTHPALSGLPHDGYCDWQFHSLLTDGQAVVFSDLPIAFAPILEVVSSYKDLHLQAALWEAQTEGGRLVVCSCHLDPTDPATAALLDGLLTYVHGRNSVPAPHVSLADLLSLVREKDRRQNLAETDMGYDPNVRG